MDNVVKDKSFAFALRIVKLAKFLQAEKKEFVLSKQVLRSGTAIGALVREAEHAQSKADFINKMNIYPCYLKLPAHSIHSNTMALFIQSGVAPLCRERPCASSRLALNKNERTLKYAPQVARV